MNIDVECPGGRQIHATQKRIANTTIDTYLYYQDPVESPTNCYIEQWILVDGGTWERKIMFLSADDVVAFGAAMQKEIERLRANGSASGSAIGTDQPGL